MQMVSRNEQLCAGSIDIMDNIETARMRLTAATAEMVRWEIADHDALGRALGAVVPGDWPPELIAEALPWFAGRLEADPDLQGWLIWYGIVRGTSIEPDRLAGSGGFIGPPAAGIVEVGYSFLPAFYRQGYGTEMIGALVDWALSHPEVQRVAAEADAKNIASVRLLQRLGFAETGPGRERGHRHFERWGV
jgi:ribosomal-protein-alanine N-acetyltransferase